MAKTKCKGCKEIEVQTCDEALCDFVVPAACVTVDVSECSIFNKDTATLQEVIDAICSLELGGGACCPNTYTLDSLCVLYRDDGDIDGVTILRVTLTPNFTQNTPTSFDIVVNGRIILPISKDVLQSVTQDEEIIIYPITIYNFGVISTETEIEIQIIDNNGNYSNIITFDTKEDLPLCEDYTENIEDIEDLNLLIPT